MPRHDLNVHTPGTTAMAWGPNGPVGVPQRRVRVPRGPFEPEKRTVARAGDVRRGGPTVRWVGVPQRRVRVTRGVRVRRGGFLCHKLWMAILLLLLLVPV